MKTLILRIVWILSRGQSLIAVLAVSLLHYATVSCFPENTTEIHRVVALIFQLAGGALVLYTINSNLVTLKNENILSTWLRSGKPWPSNNPLQTIHISAKTAASTYRAVEGTVTLTPATVEGKLEHLQKQIDELRKKHQSSLSELMNKNEEHTQELREQINKTQESQNSLKNNLNEIAIGGLTYQILGILLVLYGSITGYLAS